MAYPHETEPLTFGVRVFTCPECAEPVEIGDAELPFRCPCGATITEAHVIDQLRADGGNHKGEA